MSRDEVIAIVSEAHKNGERADLRDADLRDADMSGADLRGAYLSRAYLRGAYLSGADLRGADMSGADLRDADLRDADMSGADLRGAYLSRAYLSGATGKFCTGYFGKHHAVAAGGYISIGCERHTYQNWLDNGERIGKDNKYTLDEIADYMGWIKLAIRCLTRNEAQHE